MFQLVCLSSCFLKECRSLLVMCCGPLCRCRMLHIVVIMGCVFTFHVVMQGQVIWQELLHVEDPHLRPIAKALFHTVLSSKAPSTIKKYLYAFNRWKKWSDNFASIPTFPVQSSHLTLYLQHLAGTTQSRASVEEAVYAITWIHEMAGLTSPAANPFVQTVLSGLRRSLSQPVAKKEPISPGMLEAMVKACGAQPSLGDLRLLAACLLSFAAFLRYDEVSQLRCTDVSFYPTYLELKIRSSKTDQYRQGDTVLVARSDKVTCPVSMLEKYMQEGGLSTNSSGTLFRPLTNDGKGLRPGGSLSYSRLRELLLGRLQSLGFSTMDFGVHSLRSGGASAAAQAGVPDRLFKRHGRWRSETAKDGYVKDSVHSRLRVSQNLGI